MPPVIPVAFRAGSAPGSFNGIRYDVPTAARARDTAILAMLVEGGNPGPDAAELAADGWENLGAVASLSHALFLFRRELETGEPAHFDIEFPIALVNPPIGVLLVYRNLNNGSAVVGDVAAFDITSSANFIHPAQTLTRYSDIYIGIAAVTSDEVTFTPPAGASERLEHMGDGLSLYVFDVLPEVVGPTGTKTSVASSAVDGFAVSLALAADPLIGFGQSFTIDPLGAIGLPSRGV